MYKFEIYQNINIPPVYPDKVNKSRYNSLEYVRKSRDSEYCDVPESKNIENTDSLPFSQSIHPIATSDRFYANEILISSLSQMSEPVHRNVVMQHIGDCVQ